MTSGKGKDGYFQDDPSEKMHKPRTAIPDLQDEKRVKIFVEPIDWIYKSIFYQHTIFLKREFLIYYIYIRLCCSHSHLEDC